jgi:sucrose-6-phosphatase
MKIDRLLLCTDLDRTIIPNGRQSEHPEARACFRQLCALPEVTLVYVTGRHLYLVKQAIEQYALPTPDFAITDVGTKIYQLLRGEWHELLPWQEQIAADWQGKSHDQLQQMLSRFSELVLQEQSKQNDFKLSYYLPLDADRDRTLNGAETLLIQMGVEASLIWSVDELQHVGLLDVLPRSATKLHGIEFLRQKLGYRREELIFAGDSGNDLPVLASPIPSILVANADQQVKQQAQQLTEENGCAESLYLAQQNNFPLGGNYSAGVLQGVVSFAPEIGAKLKLP